MATQSSVSGSFLEKIRKVRKATALKLKDCPWINPDFTPFPYQVAMIANMLLVKCMVNGEDVGMGKTVEAACMYAFRYWMDPQLNCLIVSPKNALFQWQEEFKKVAPKIPVSVIQTEPPKRSGFSKGLDWRKHLYSSFVSGVMVCNYHQLFREFELICAALKKFIVIFDEATAFKNTESKLHKVVKVVSGRAEARYALTATVIKNHLLEAFAVCEGLGISPWGSLFRFKQQFAEFKKIPISLKGRRVWIQSIVGWKNLPQFKAEFEPFYFGRSTEQVAGNLPTVCTRNVIFDMVDKVREKYQEAEDGLLQIADGEIINTTALTKLLYCQLLSNSPREMGFDLPDTKIEMMWELLEHELAGEKVLIFSRFRRLIDYLEKQFVDRDFSVLRITGLETDVQRHQAKLEFTNNPAVKFMLLNMAGADAINLQIARAIVCLDLPWSYGDYKQLVGRIRRQGSKHSMLMVYHLMHHSSIDQYTLEVLQEKRNLIVGAAGHANEILEGTDLDFAKSILREMRKYREGMKYE
jgi:SNF2 family DNA or RNA helicase